MTTRYPVLLFDADDTLFDYRAAEAAALREAFEHAAVPFDEAWLGAYHVVNSRAWRDLEAGRIDAATLRVRRFEELFADLGLALDPPAFAAIYLARLSTQSQLISGAAALLAAVRPGRRLAIVTNGLSDVQRPRLAASPIAPLIDHLVISEEVGAAKPDPAIFRVALERMGAPDPRDVLMIGDNAGSDIAGAIGAGLDTCWYNPDGRAAPGGVRPTHEIRRLADLEGVLGG